MDSFGDVMCIVDMYLGMKTVRIFSDRIRDRIHLEGF
jgi:hypothetical protein